MTLLVRELKELGVAQNDTLTTFLVACITFGFWVLRFAVTRYFYRKEKTEERKRDTELKKLLEEDIHKHKQTKHQ